LTVLPALSLLIALAACERIAEEAGLGDPHEPSPILSHPVIDRDLTEIINGGVIRLATRYNSSSYFIYKGGHAGFEYELFALFVKGYRKHEMRLEISVLEPGEDPVTLLNSGRADVLATGAPLPDPWSRHLLSTRPYNYVHKTLVLPALDPRPNTLSALNDLTIHLPVDSAFRPALQDLRQRFQLRFFIAKGGPLGEDEDLINRVAQGEIPAAVVDGNIALAALSYLPEVRISTQLSEMQPVTLQVRQNSPDLLAALNTFIKQHYKMSSRGPQRSTEYGTLYKRYYQPRPVETAEPVLWDRPEFSKRISPWDDLIRAAADSVGLDWRLVAALVYQESRFDPDAESKAGAKGLMQIMPGLAGEDSCQLSNPQTNVRIGVRHLKAIHDSYGYLAESDRLAFILATYHAGAGHMADARLLAILAGRDPNRWQGVVDQMLPLLSETEHYEKTQYGFFPGRRTVSYVQSILNRYDMYRRSMTGPETTETVLRGVPTAKPEPE
jgi:membrane-bound lytic murein transglycosylase F